jgi:hypothetical protein
VRVTLNQPGLYWFGCPISNHAGRGMLGLIMVKGETEFEVLVRPGWRRSGETAYRIYLTVE